jgi:hypothetical protein
MKQAHVYELIASFLQARDNCIDKMRHLNPNAVTASIPIQENEYHRLQEWRDRHESTIEQLVADFLPSGAGWDHGTKINFDRSTPEKLVFYGSYHHMNEGFYSGWTDHTIIVRPSLVSDYVLAISGRNRNDIKDYLYQTFDYALRRMAYWRDTDSRYHHAPIDPFASVADFNRCVSCYGRASQTIAGQRYCAGCGIANDTKV